MKIRVYGGFKRIGETCTTAIYSHKAGQDGVREYLYSDESVEPPYFANTNAISIYINHTTQSKNIPEKELLTIPAKTNIKNPAEFEFLTNVIPAACSCVNEEAPYTIGPYLKCVKISHHSPIEELAIKYVETSEGVIQPSPALEDMPPCITYRSLQESNKALRNGQLIKYPFCPKIGGGFLQTLAVINLFKARLGNVGFQKLIDEKHGSDGQYYLGLLYCVNYDCRRIQSNYLKASQWFKKAADRGHASAQYRLGVLYYKGIGVPQNYELAREWLQKSANQGLDEAKNFLTQFSAITAAAPTPSEPAPTHAAALAKPATARSVAAPR